MSKNFVALGLLLALPAGLLVPLSRADRRAPEKSTKRFDGIDQYQEKRIQGWRVLVNKRLLAKENRKLARQTLKVLANHLFRITRVVPAGPLAKIRKIPIWVELAEGHHPCMCYHVSPDWLRGHSMNPQKAGAVELANARNFLDWTHQQPWMVLHELAHGYHDQVLGFDNAEVRACYQRALASKSYESVLHYDGRKVRHYALTNDREYFAEASEAYFGTNDFFPFVRPELKQHDPNGYKLMEKVWEVGQGGKKRQD